RAAPGGAAKQGTGFTGLGFREVRVDLMADDEPRQRRVPGQFALASAACRDLKASGRLARRIVQAMPIRSPIQLVEHGLTPLNAKLREAVLERLAKYLDVKPRPRRPKPWPPYNPLRTTI